MAIKVSGIDYKTQDARSGKAAGLLHVIDSVDVSTLGASELYGIQDNVLGFSKAAVQVVWSGGSGTGTVEIKVSNDGINYNSLATPATASITGAAGSAIVDAENDYKYIGIAVSKNSGGTLDVYLSVKA